MVEPARKIVWNLLIAGMIFFTAALQWTQVVIPIQEKVLGSILAGIFMGTGSGVTLRSLGSAGGLDILSVILLKVLG